MKVAVLDLGTVFAKFFKSSVSPITSGPSANPFAQGSNTEKAPFAPKTPFLLVSAPPSPLPILNSSTSSLSRVPSGKSTTNSPHPGVISAPGSPSHSTKPQTPNPANTILVPPQQVQEEPWTCPQPATSSPTPPATIMVRPAASSSTSVISTIQSTYSSRSPRLLQETSISGWNTKSMLFTLPDIGEEGTDYEDSFHSHGKGISQASSDHRHSEKAAPLPIHFTRPVQEAIHNYRCESVSSLSSSGQTTPTELHNSWSAIQSYTTGLSTERSSVYSWTDDEFDKANTQKVHQLFWDVDEMLFEGTATSQNKNLQAECKDWTRRSLHLRILGKQLIFPSDEGFQYYPSRSQCSSALAPSTQSQCTAEGLGASTQLIVSGSKVIPTASPLQSSSSSGFQSSAYSFLEEEIYDADGTVEEYLAFDSREHDDESLDQKKAQNHHKRSKRGIPPVSPSDCIKDTVAAEAFDDVWRSVVKSFQELLIKSWEAATDDKKHSESTPSTVNKSLQLPVPRITSATTGVPPSRGSEARSVSFGTYVFTPQISRNLNDDLNGVMTIQAKPLQQRHSGLIERTHEQEDKSLNILPRGLNSARNRLGRLNDNLVLSSSRILNTPSRKIATHRRLPALNLEPIPPKTPNVYSDEVLRGTKLYTAQDRLSSPSIQISRNKLPPITSDTVERLPFVPGSRNSANRGKHPHSRVSSAVPDTTGRRPLKERTVIVEQFSRPNTTHTFRSEISHRRSFTPLDFSNHTWTGQAFLTSSQYRPKSFQRNAPSSRRKVSS
ncbi:protein FAM149A [Gastrophryne carolinensis]